MGDMNLDLLKFESHGPTSDYLDLMMSHSLLPMITRPTRIKHSSASLIDHIFYKSDVMKTGILACEIAGSHGFTDHFPVFCILGINNDKTRPKKTIHKTYFTTDGHEKRRQALRDQCWDHFFAENDPDIAYQMFQNKYCFFYNDSLTSKSFEVKWDHYPREPWMTSEIIRKMKRRDRLLRQPGRRDDYKHLRNEIVANCRKAEHDYYKKKVSENWNNIKEQWNILRRAMGKVNDKSGFPSAFFHNDTWMTDKQQISNNMNAYYSAVGPDTNKSVGASKKDSLFFLSKNKERLTHQLLTCRFNRQDVFNAPKVKL